MVHTSFHIFYAYLISVGGGGGGGGLESNQVPYIYAGAAKGLASFPGSYWGGVESLLHTVDPCSVTLGFLHRNIILSIAVLLFPTDVYKLSKMVLSQEPVNEAKLILMVVANCRTAFPHNSWL